MSVRPKVRFPVEEDNAIDPTPIKAKIVHVLTIYPVLSPSMLQVGLGTSLPSYVWAPILEQMIQEGIVIREDVFKEHPSGRTFKYGTLRLKQ